ncbi:glycosyltransferase [Lunatibacter salilacus]|uniref:glycosyltransferase n=1 Tax=Lunatibacter salilacus TaxID=2483804 RepID=UPI00131AB619|nr:glycosyltransferase [Lunatibacter salilacus]
MFFSIIIPVFNRPDEIVELLESISLQENILFEVIVVEDGSTLTCKERIAPFNERINLSYVFQENTGQGFARNRGISLAKGDFFIFFDSDCVLPKGYLVKLYRAIQSRNLDAFGGPDDAGEGFSAFQKAMNFSMTSFWTTGGIRGKMKDPSKFQARGFNMGFSRKVFDRVGGFIDPNMAEDIEISLRIKKAGFRLELVQEAYVFHHRKNTFVSFLRQSFQFGRNRVHISTYHPDAVQFVHVLPVLFLLGLFAIPLVSLLSPALFPILVGVYLCWGLGVVISSTWGNRSILVGTLAFVTSVGQLAAYGAGFLRQWLYK